MLFIFLSPFIYLPLLMIYTIKNNETRRTKIKIISTILLTKIAIFFSYFSNAFGVEVRLEEESPFNPHFHIDPRLDIARDFAAISVFLSMLSIFLCLVILPQNRRIIRWIITLTAIASLRISAYRLAEAMWLSRT
ncbi:MAG: hypothetical protein RIE73_13865 [Coleofasciculus sp. C1-SOL-03]|jgi:formate hydrogenlyase subunit 3/multisubunit Na+/H+ antiporter MnhD subunit|uniref:hypothetical protein n=1 Tax=Coleofasciculus sp. C1-SOL-03 TaxID=3069522 RepID=UPI0032F64A1B